MALVRKDQYTGQITGRRKATNKEQRTLGRTTYAPGVRRHVSPEGDIVIIVTWEYYNKNKKQWLPATFNGKSPDGQWNFRSLTAAADYITAYMHRKGAEPNNKNGKEYFISENGYWKKVKDDNGKEVYKFFQYTNKEWDNGLTLFSQWIIKGKKYMYRITFEQVKEVTRRPNDYHDQPASPWSHSGTRTITNGQQSSTMTVRTYRGEDPIDHSDKQREARRRERMAINREERELANYPLTALEQQHENLVHMESRKAKGEKVALKWLRKIRKTNPTWLQYAANARSIAEYAVKRLDNEEWTIEQADQFCEKNAKYI